MPPARARLTAWITAGLALAATALLLLLPLPRRLEGGCRGDLMNLGHVPLFAGLTFGLWAVCGRRWYPPALLSLALAGLAEVVQPSVGRTGDFADFLRGAAGCLAAASLLRAAEGRRSGPRLTLHALVALALVAIPVFEVGPTLVDAAEGFADFPTLADFDAPRRLRRWECHQAGLQLVRRADRSPPFALRIEFRPGPSPYPSATLQHISRDFTGYRHLCWSFTVEGEPLTLVFSLRGGPDEAGVTSHHQFGRTFPPGDHVARMELPDAALLARPGSLDLGDLWWSQLFVVRPAEPRVILLWRVWLE
jgi:hypothetical protein